MATLITKAKLPLQRKLIRYELLDRDGDSGFYYASDVVDAHRVALAALLDRAQARLMALEAVLSPEDATANRKLADRIRAHLEVAR